MKATSLMPLGLSLAFLTGGCAALSPAPTVAPHALYDNDKEVVFQALLGTFQEMGMEMRTADEQNGKFKTKWIDAKIDAHTTLHYQITAYVTQSEAGKTDVSLRAQGEKRHSLAGLSYSAEIDESDSDVKTTLDGILSATTDKLRSIIPQ